MGGLGVLLQMRREALIEGFEPRRHRIRLWLLKLPLAAVWRTDCRG